MISLEAMKTAFTNYRYFYGSAPIGTKLPYLVASGTESDNFMADDKVFEKKFGLQLEYYSSTKSETNEAAVEAILDSLGLLWDKTESYDEEQTFFLTTYNFWR